MPVQASPATVVERIRRIGESGLSGPNAVTTAELRSYCDSLPQKTASDYSGCYKWRSTESGCVFGASYNCACNDGCITFPLCCFLGFLCGPSPICLCEQQGNAFVGRDKGRIKTMLLAADDERGTFAWVSMGCCTQELGTYPDCICERV